MVQAKQIEIDRDRIVLDPGRIMKYLGVPVEEDDRHTLHVIESYISTSLEAMSPRGGFARFKAVPTGSSSEIAIPGTSFRTGKIVGEKLLGAQEYVLFMGTAGPGPESMSATLLEKGEYLEGVIADVIASSIAEAVAGQLHSHIIDLADLEGIRTTNRYSPGYCSWKVSEQHLLFKQFPAGFCGISLSGSSLMSPIKSVSGVIGLGSTVTFKPYTCDGCTIKHCVYREPHTFYQRD